MPFFFPPDSLFKNLSWYGFCIRAVTSLLGVFVKLPSSIPIEGHLMLTLQKNKERKMFSEHSRRKMNAVQHPPLLPSGKCVQTNSINCSVSGCSLIKPT